MPDNSNSKGYAIGLIAVGGIFAYSGIRGLSVTSAIQAIIKGKSPSTATTADQWNVTASTGGAGGSSGGTGAGISGSPALGGGSLPTGAFMNAQAIYSGLRGMGLSKNAAAGVAGNIYQESHGNPSIGSSAGGGLFGLTIANGGTVGGGSLGQQLSALNHYIAQNGSIADINANASSPSAAADWFSSKYERPGIPNLATREAAANWVASQSWAV